MSNHETAYISLGSNLGNSEEMLEKARKAINALPGCEIVGSSAIYETEPQGLKDQPWFQNQVLRTVLTGYWKPQAFLTALLDIEAGLGRKRTGPHFGPRVIDIDLLLFGQESCALPDCLLPHPRMCQRAFVLVPLLELEPGLHVQNNSLVVLLAGLHWHKQGLRIFQETAGEKQ